MSLQPAILLLTGRFPSRLCPDITAQLVCGQRVKYRPALGRVGGGVFEVYVFNKWLP